MRAAVTGSSGFVGSHLVPFLRSRGDDVVTIDRTGTPPVDVTDPVEAGRRIEELERKIGQQQLDLDFFRAALRHVRERRLKKGEPGDTTSTR